ncbi:hypothetical protein ACQPZF_03405 [Actinosynnema sp. CS-041913]|uniref:hypothetical protein n=1 Tax=Actinosynnema sp. CS-041913 TaxID=3239917 RepID=UPI003D93D72A
MSEPVDDAAAAAVEEAARRRRLAEVFGEVLPDEVDEPVAPGRDERGRDDQWYLENRPPHHE